MIETLINRFEALKGNRKSSEIKALSCILYHFGLSYRKVAKALERFERFSHQSVKDWYRKARKLLPVVKPKHRKAIAVDETKIKLEDEQLFIWEAIDMETREVIAVHVSYGRRN